MYFVVMKQNILPVSTIKCKMVCVHYTITLHNCCVLCLLFHSFLGLAEKNCRENKLIFFKNY